MAELLSQGGSILTEHTDILIKLNFYYFLMNTYLKKSDLFTSGASELHVYIH